MQRGMRGEQADITTVADFQKRLAALCDEAKDAGVVLTVECKALLPLAMGHHEMMPLARPQWFNSDKQLTPQQARDYTIADFGA